MSTDLIFQLNFYYLLKHVRVSFFYSSVHGQLIATMHLKVCFVSLCNSIDRHSTCRFAVDGEVHLTLSYNQYSTAVHMHTLAGHKTHETT